MLESNIATGSPETPVTLNQDEKSALVEAYLEGVSTTSVSVSVFVLILV